MTTRPETQNRPHRNEFVHLWDLDPEIVFLNHGSFGATPKVVLERQSELRRQMEAEPVRFFVRELEPLLDAARARAAEFVGADPESLAFVPNATAGVNAVLRSLDFKSGDVLLTTTHEYNASRNTLDYVANKSGAIVQTVDIPLPVANEDDVVDRVVSAVGPRTRLLLIDYITSQTALVLPVERIVREFEKRGIEVLIDGAHAPGMVPLSLDALGASYFTGNCHKWICAPKGAAILYVRSDKRHLIRPTSISHGANSARTDRSRFHLEFDWTGTADPTACLSVPVALDFIDNVIDAGWLAVSQRNRRLVLEARAKIDALLGNEPLAPESMIGSMAACDLPLEMPGGPSPSLYGDPLQDALLEDFGIEVPIIAFPASPRRLIRVSAQLYNDPSDFDGLVDALRALLIRK